MPARTMSAGAVTACSVSASAVTASARPCGTSLAAVGAKLAGDLRVFVLHRVPDSVQFVRHRKTN